MNAVIGVGHNQLQSMRIPGVVSEKCHESGARRRRDHRSAGKEIDTLQI